MCVLQGASPPMFVVVAWCDCQWLTAAFRRAARRPYKSPSGCPKFTFRRGFNEILIILLFKVINWAISYFSPVTGAIPEAVATLGG